MADLPDEKELSDVLRKTHQCVIELEVDPITAIYIVGLVQLALQHPGLDPEKTETAARVAEAFVSQVGERVNAIAPEYGELIKAGWRSA